LKPHVTTVIPSWNGRELLVECIESLAAQTYEDTEVVVVDDGSTDRTGEAVAARFPKVTLERMPENTGFCVATNTGIRMARGELILLLNNDMTLEADFVERLVEAADVSDAAMFAPLVLWRDEPDVIYSAGDRQRSNGRPEPIGFRMPVSEFAFDEPPFGVTAGAGLYRRAVFDRVGLLDERFNCYFSDSDLSFRARLAGFEATFVREAVCYHVGSASLMGANWRRSRECCRNHALVVLKNMPASTLARHAPAVAAERLHQMRQVVSAVRCEFGLARALGILAGTWASTMAAAPHALRHRRSIQRNRVLNPGELDALLAKGSI
jgi:GT2 family glycosyltransferase